MPSYKRPGVYVEEVLNASTSGGLANSDSLAAFIGVSNRGPVVPTLIANWSDYTRLFGGFSNGEFLPFSMFQFFANGGSGAYVSRVVSATGAVKATRILTDRATVPLSTLKIDAANPGIWGNSLFIDIEQSAEAGRFNLIVKFGSVASADIVERFPDLSMRKDDSRYAVTLVNSLSSYVVLTDMNSLSVHPLSAPSLQAGTVLATGADGTVPGATDFLAAVEALDNIHDPLVLNLAGVTDAATLSQAVSYAEQRGSIFVICDLPQTTTPTQAIAAAGALTISSYGAAYWPWITVSDPSKNTPGAVKAVPPGGSLVGAFMKNDRDFGVHKTPAGVGVNLAGLVDVATKPTDSQLDLLNTSSPPVNVIRRVPGYGIRVMGGRTLKPGQADKYISARRSLIYIKVGLKNLTQFAIFEPNDQTLWATLVSECTYFLREFHALGGLKGSTAASSFYVKSDGVLNGPQSVANGEVRVEVGVALQFPAEFVVIRVGQFEGGSSAVES